MIGKISVVEQEDILSRINTWLDTVFPYKTESAYICEIAKVEVDNFRIITKGRKKFDIYIRFGDTWLSDSSKTIVIARIGFEKRRSGHGTRFLKHLLSIALEYDYTDIGIEMVNSNSKLFAQKFGFEPHNNGSNYIISTDRLKLQLVGILD
ncbi:GNAT family N-acetyltransferase [Enterobacter mori]|uniref:GNAT family N-acetyltransferase n=1 Tax=Enterobacter mori TaxID=539813 RepID=UPI001BA47BF8|nr:GNAT family N-acetyltransferase [Enterobacter mori]MBS0862913.1 GNAT family N-acetyltransferase [Enterobacter mori]